MPRSRRVVGIIGLVGLLIGTDGTLWGAEPRPGDDAAVRTVIQNYVEARESRNPTTIALLFTEDADQLVSDGTWRRGRATLVQGMLESSRRTGGKRSITVEIVRFLGPDLALVDGRYRQEGLAEGKERLMWTSITLQRGGEGWRIAAIRNMEPTSPR